MMDFLHKFKSLLAADSKPIDAERYTPHELVSGYIKSAPGLNPLEAAWHTASVTLETERIRLVYRLADEGIYFIAADAADFIAHPDANNPLSAALPGAGGHMGNGAYFCDIGYGSIAVVIKGEGSLRCYVGDRAEVLQFASGCDEYWVDSEDGDSWIGFRYLENRQTQRLVNAFVMAGGVLTALFLAVYLIASWRTAVVTSRADVAVQKIRAQEQDLANELNKVPPEAFAGYRDLITPLLAKEGRLLQVESTGETIKFEMELPSWVSAADLSVFGRDLSSKVDGDHVVVSKGF